MHAKVNMENFDKRLQKHKYNPNYIHENIGFLKELIVAAPKHHSGLCAIVVLLLDVDRQVYKGIELKAKSSDAITEYFPDLGKKLLRIPKGVNFSICRGISRRSAKRAEAPCNVIQRA